MLAFLGDIRYAKGAFIQKHGNLIDVVNSHCFQRREHHAIRFF